MQKMQTRSLAAMMMPPLKLRMQRQAHRLPLRLRPRLTATKLSHIQLLGEVTGLFVILLMVLAKEITSTPQRLFRLG